MPIFPNGLRIITTNATTDFPLCRTVKMDTTTNGFVLLFDAGNVMLAAFNKDYVIAGIVL